MTTTIGFQQFPRHEHLNYCPVCKRLLAKPGIYLKGTGGRLYVDNEDCERIWETLPESQRREIATAVRVKGWAILEGYDFLVVHQP